MRIGIFTDTYPPFINGVSTSVVMLERALKKKGHQVYIVTVNPENMSFKYENNDHIIRIPGIPTGIYDYRLTGIYPLPALKKIKKWNLDVIHSHTEFGVGTFARLVAKQYNIPLVHTYHTMYEDYVHYVTKGYFIGPGKKIVEYLTKFYCDQTATELIVPTKKTYDLFKEKYKVDRNVHIVPTGIEIERFYKEKLKKEEIEKLKQELKIKKDDFVILFVGRLASEKSVDVLIDAHTSICKKYENAKLLVVGDGPDIDKFKKLTQKLKISDNVIFTGKVPWKDVPKYYAISSVFSTASKSETQGLTVIEAMAASLPVVCVKDESFEDAVIDGLNGYFFKTKKQYKQLIEELIENNKLVKKMGNQARINAELHSSKYFAERVLDVYKIAIGIDKKNNKSFLSRLKKVVGESINGK